VPNYLRQLNIILQHAKIETKEDSMMKEEIREMAHNGTLLIQLFFTNKKERKKR
jgi:hypothetical protein